MQDRDCVEFLQWCLPRLALRWPGYRKVRRTVRKRLGRRLRELGLADLDAYRGYLHDHPEEWRRIDVFCRIPISRFYRDSGVFDRLGGQVLPELAAAARARGDGRVRCWSAGCASGEEAYSLKLAWERRVRPGFPEISLESLGTEVDAGLLARAEHACYPAGSLKDLPQGWREDAFSRDGELFCLRKAFKQGIRFQQQDIRDGLPAGRFDLICCRNLVFTYFAAPLQKRLLDEIAGALRHDGYLVIGAHEALPETASPFSPLAAGLPIYRKTAGEDI
jgi:chemotaxis protein methyltransferase CheR